MVIRNHCTTARRAILLCCWTCLIAVETCCAAAAEQSEVAKAAPTLGYSEFEQADHGTTTVFYPSSSQGQIKHIGPFELSLAKDGAITQGNGHLIVISHGSGGSPWVHTDLARILVQHGFTVVLPQHYKDNYRDQSDPGPASWRLRPLEVSKSIDLVASAPRFSSHLSFDSVGVFGGSAGGHTALSLAGGKWSAEGFRVHCQKHINEDFNSCVGFVTELHNNWFDQIKIWTALKVIDYRFSDPTLLEYSDPRIHAAIAMVPFAADFVPDSLSSPRIPLGLVIAEQDHNQIPTFHVKRILAACLPRCEIVMDLSNASHGAMLSPMPQWEAGSLEDKLLGDPPNFDRTGTIPELNQRIAVFFENHLLNRSATGQ